MEKIVPEILRTLRFIYLGLDLTVEEGALPKARSFPFSPS